MQCGAAKGALSQAQFLTEIVYPNSTYPREMILRFSAWEGAKTKDALNDENSKVLRLKH